MYVIQNKQVEVEVEVDYICKIRKSMAMEMLASWILKKNILEDHGGMQEDLFYMSDYYRYQTYIVMFWLTMQQVHLFWQYYIWENTH